MDPVTLQAAKADAARRYYKKGQTARGVICLVADDLYDSQYTWLMPKVEALGGKMTFAYYTSGLNNGVSHMTTAQVADASARGHEIASHSTFHNDMTGLSASARTTEWTQCKAEILSITGISPVNWIYPFSARNAATDAEGYFHYQRAFWGVDGQYIVPIDADVIPVAIGRFSLTSASLTRAKALVTLAQSQPVRITIYTHDISGSGVISTTEMQSLLDAISTAGVPLVTLKEAFPAHRPCPDRNFSGFTNAPTTDVWTTSDTGTSANLASVEDTITGPPGLTSATSLKMTSTDAASSRTATMTLNLPVRPGRAFSLSLWMKLTYTSGGGGGYVYCDEYNISGTLLASTLVGSLVGATAGWTYVVKDWNLQPDTQFVVPRLNIATLVGTCWFTNVWPAETAENMRTPPHPDWDNYRGVMLTSGEATMLRDDITTETAAASGSLRLTYFTAKKTEDITQIKAYSGTTSAGSTPTLVKMGVYAEDASTGDLTLVASTASDTALFASQNTPYTRSFTSTFHKVKGQRYAVADIVVSGATIPKLMGMAAATGNVEYGIAPRLTGNVASQSDLLTTISAGSITSSAARRYMALLP